MVDHNPCHGWELMFEPQGWRSTPLTPSNPTCCGKKKMHPIYLTSFKTLQKPLFDLKNYIVQFCFIINHDYIKKL
jgi:hypothetical protein